MDEDEKRYQVYGYGDDDDALAGGQHDRGMHDERLHAEAVARDTVRRDGLRSAQVMRCRDGKVVYYFDREEG
jgi:hypothetical protein